MFVNVSTKAEENKNRGRINVKDINLQSMPDKTSAHVQHILIDKQIGKSYDASFFQTELKFKRVLCGCE